VNHAQFVELLRAIFDTRDDEIVCSEFFELLPTYVDLVLATADASRLQLGRPSRGAATGRPSYPPVLGVRRSLRGAARD
jgi:hypothetical protein